MTKNFLNVSCEEQTGVVRRCIATSKLSKRIQRLLEKRVDDWSKGNSNAVVAAMTSATNGVILLLSGMVFCNKIHPNK